MATRRVVVVGRDGAAVARVVARLRHQGARAAGFVGDDRAVAREMSSEILGGVDEVLWIDADGASRR